MGLFTDIFRPRKNKQAKIALSDADGFFKMLTGYRPVYSNWQGQLYESEIIRSAVDTNARYVSKSKVVINGDTRSKLATQLKYKPNAWQTWSQWLYRVSTILDMCNTVFIIPVLDNNLDTVGYFPALPQKCEVLEYKGVPWVKYKFSGGDVGVVEMSKCGILTKHQFYNDFFGEKNLPALDSTVDLLVSAKRSIKNAAESANDYKFMAQLDNFAKVNDLAKERKRFTDKNLKAEEDNEGVLVFPVTYKNIKQITPSEFTVSEKQIELINNNVYSYFGVNQDLVQGKTESKFIDSYYDGTIEPRLNQMTQVMTNVIFTQREQANGARIHFERELSTKDRVSMAQQLGDRGMITINEARALFDYPPIENGDILPVRGEYYMLGGAGNTDNQKASEKVEGAMTSADFQGASDIGIQEGVNNEQTDGQENTETGI